MKSVLVGLKNILLWSYGRGTWQYDALCVLIVLTLLFWPVARRTATQANAAHTPASQSADGMRTREIEINQLRAFLQEQNRPELANSPREAVVLYLQSQTQSGVVIAALEPFGNAQGQTGYRVQYRLN
jgi:hypothetical protein